MTENLLYIADEFLFKLYGKTNGKFMFTILYNNMGKQSWLRIKNYEINHFLLCSLSTTKTIEIPV